MLHTLHRCCALVIASFVSLHLFNHLLALSSVNAHLEMMRLLRLVYRQPLLEALLLLAVVYQICSGLYFVKSRWRERHGFFDKLQAASGTYLAFFLAVHVSAVLFGRHGLQLDTNFYYAAAGMHVTPYHYFFMPYYFFAVAAIFAHIACGAHWLLRDKLSESARNGAAYAMLALGLCSASLIVAAFAGAFYSVEIPQKYRATYGNSAQ